MLFNKDELDTKTLKELHAIAIAENVAIDKSLTKQEIIELLILESAKQPVEDVKEVKEVESEGKKEPYKHPRKQTKLENAYSSLGITGEDEPTIEQLKVALNDFILRGLKLFFHKDSNTWEMRVQLSSLHVRDKNTGLTRITERWKVDSGTLCQPLKIIVRCASILMQNVPAQRDIDLGIAVNHGLVEVA